VGEREITSIGSGKRIMQFEHDFLDKV